MNELDTYTVLSSFLFFKKNKYCVSFNKKKYFVSLNKKKYFYIYFI